MAGYCASEDGAMLPERPGMRDVQQRMRAEGKANILAPTCTGRYVKPTLQKTTKAPSEPPRPPDPESSVTSCKQHHQSGGTLTKKKNLDPMSLQLKRLAHALQPHVSGSTHPMYNSPPSIFRFRQPRRLIHCRNRLIEDRERGSRSWIARGET